MWRFYKKKELVIYNHCVNENSSIFWKYENKIVWSDIYANQKLTNGALNVL